VYKQSHRPFSLLYYQTSKELGGRKGLSNIVNVSDNWLRNITVSIAIDCTTLLQLNNQYYIIKIKPEEM